MPSFYETIKMQPHPAQVKVLQDNHDNIVVASSRRGGKSMAAIIKILQVALDFDNWIASRGNPGYKISKASPAVIAVVTPTRDMAKGIYFKPIVELLQSSKQLSGLVKTVNRSALSIEFHGNRPQILFGSTSDDANTWRGKSIVLLIADEVADIPFTAIDGSLKPAMTSVKGSQMWAIGSPKGQGTNALWKFKQLCDRFPEYYSFHRFTILDNPYISKDIIKQELFTKSAAVFAREYMADFSNFQSMVYSELSECNQVALTDLKPVVDPKTGKCIRRLAVDHGSANCAIGLLGLYEDPKGGKQFVYLKGWQNKSGKSIATQDFKNEVVKWVNRYQPQWLLCDPALPGDVLDIRNMVKGSAKVMSGFNKILPGVAIVRDLIYQQKLLFLSDDFDSDNDPNTVSGLEAYEKFQSYAYVTAKDGSVDDQKIAPGLDDHQCDLVRYALASPDPSLLKNYLQPSVVKKPDPRRDPESKAFDPGLVLTSR